MLCTTFQKSSLLRETTVCKDSNYLTWIEQKLFFISVDRKIVLFLKQSDQNWLTIDGEDDGKNLQSHEYGSIHEKVLVINVPRWVQSHLVKSVCFIISARDECPADACHGASKCARINGVNTCFCPHGYQLNPEDPTRCVGESGVPYLIPTASHRRSYVNAWKYKGILYVRPVHQVIIVFSRGH